MMANMKFTICLMYGTMSSGINHHRVSLIITDLYVALDEFLAFSQKSHTCSNVTVIHPTIAGNLGKYHICNSWCQKPPETDCSQGIGILPSDALSPLPSTFA
jgi:hypothetical protein